MAASGPAVCLCAAQASLAPVSADKHSVASPGAQHVGAPPPQPASPVQAVEGEPSAMEPPQPLGGAVTSAGIPAADAAAANGEQEVTGADVADDAAAAAAEEEAEAVPAALTPVVQGLLHRRVAAGMHTLGSSV